MSENKPVTKGSKAPLFTLPDETGTKHSLKDLIATNPVILIFYPGDMTPGCTVQLRCVRNDWKKFQDAGVTVFGVNHANAESHKKFKEAFQFPFPLLIDTGKHVSDKYNAVKPFFKSNIIKRTVVCIGTDGVIFYYKRGMPKDSEILKAVKTWKASNK
jgi:peroxiredoxin Q/BCP